MYQALYRKYRPKNFTEVVGQKVIVQTLINSIQNNKISHAYIFSGPRGTGKTSIAKIFARTVNCKNTARAIPCEKCDNCINYLNNNNIDIIEIDAASNNGVDEIRNLKNSVNLVPNNSKYKVYIIDEVHMLSSSAFNALLKTLEEPPEFVIFILATTELYKVPETIISRCQNFDFQRITNKEIVNRLLYICENEKIQISEIVLKNIAIFSNGGLRDSISLLDQLASYKNGKIEIEDFEELCGLISNEQMYELINNMLNDNLNYLIKKIYNYNDEGKNLVIIFERVVDILKNVLIYANASEYFNNEEEKKKYDEYLKVTEEHVVYNIIDIFNEYINKMKNDNNRVLLAQLCILKTHTILNKSGMDADGENKKIKENIENNSNNNSKSNYNSVSEKKKNIEIVEIDNFLEFKKIRINNALAQFNKKDFLKFKKEITNIKEYINDNIYGSVVSILLEGEMKVKGGKYIIYVYSDQNFTNYFNNSIVEIEDLLYKLYNQKYKVIATDLDNWEIIKKEFNSNLKKGINKYTLKKDVILNKNENNDESLKNNDIDNMFQEIVKYE